MRKEEEQWTVYVLRQTIRKRLQTKLNEVKAELQRRMHEPIPDQGKWLQAVVRGHIGITACPGTKTRCGFFGFQVGGSGTARCRGAARTAASFGIACGASSNAGWPLPIVCHPYPLRRMGVVHLRQEPDAVVPLVRIRGGVVSNHDPYSD